MNQKIQKQEIITRAKRLVRHREKMMKEFGAKPQFKTTRKILDRLDFFSSRDLKTICRLIINMQGDIKSILAGETSRFYKSDQRKADELFQLCNNNLNQ
jgi:hypothetical protein